jgi:hypothetical protein
MLRLEFPLSSGERVRVRGISRKIIDGDEYIAGFFAAERPAFLKSRPSPQPSPRRGEGASVAS